MTGDLTSRCGVEQRPPSSTAHRLPQQHPVKTDEIEILESAGGGGADEQQQDKVFWIYLKF